MKISKFGVYLVGLYILSLVAVRFLLLSFSLYWPFCSIDNLLFGGLLCFLAGYVPLGMIFVFLINILIVYFVGFGIGKLYRRIR